MVLGRNYNSPVGLTYAPTSTQRSYMPPSVYTQQPQQTSQTQSQGMGLPVGQIAQMFMGSGGSATGAAGTGLASAGTTAGASVTGAGATGAGGTASAAAGGASMLPALGWAAPFVAGAAALSADAMQRGADENDLLRWWGGPVTNVVEGDFDKAAKGTLRVAGGPFGGLWDLIEGENTEMAIGSSLLGPMGAGLTGLIMGKKSEDIIPWFSGFVE